MREALDSAVKERGELWTSPTHAGHSAGGNPKPTAEPPTRYTTLLLETLIAYRKGSA